MSATAMFQQLPCWHTIPASAMRYKLLLFALLPLLFTVDAQPQNPARVCVRHITPPTRYPIFARLARLQGTVVAKLRIAADGSVAEAVVEAEDPSLIAHPILQSETQQLVRKWTFEVPIVRSRRCVRARD